LKSTETESVLVHAALPINFSNFGSLKSTETRHARRQPLTLPVYFSNFGSLKSTETRLSKSQQRSWRSISAISAR